MKGLEKLLELFGTVDPGVSDLSLVRFAAPRMLWLLVLVPLLALLFHVALRRRRAALEKFGEMALVSKLSASSSPRRQTTRMTLFLLAMTSLILAMARPQIGTKVEIVTRKGLDIVIAVDTSASMNAEDAMGRSKGRRIEKAKHEISALLDTLENDRVGLVAFAGTAHIQCPLTLDYDAVNIFLDVIDTNLIPDPGTAIGAAVETALKMFDRNEKKYKALILITDGEDHLTDPIKAAKDAEKEGVKIFPIGIGLPQGTPIPEYDENGNKAGMKKDRDGNMVLSSLDEVTLEKMALSTGGKYYPASVGEMELRKIHQEIAGMDKKQLAARKYTHYEDRFQGLLVLGLILLTIEAAISTRAPRGRRRNGNVEPA